MKEHGFKTTFPDTKRKDEKKKIAEYFLGAVR